MYVHSCIASGGHENLLAFCRRSMGGPRPASIGGSGAICGGGCIAGACLEAPAPPVGNKLAKLEMMLSGEMDEPICGGLQLNGCSTTTNDGEEVLRMVHLAAFSVQ